MSKIIATLFYPKTNTFTHLEEYINFEKFVNHIILFDLKLPFIININGDINFLNKIIMKFNNTGEGNLIIKHIKTNAKDKLSIDGVFTMKNIAFLNHNIIIKEQNYKANYPNKLFTEITKENIKMFFLKNLLICFNLNPDNKILNEILTEKMKLITNKEFFKLNRTKIVGKSEATTSLDDINLEFQSNNLDNDYYDYFAENLDKSNTENKISSSSLHNLNDKKEKLKSFKKSQKNLELEHYIFDNFKKQKILQNKFDLIYFYINLFNYSVNNLNEYLDNILKEGEELKNLYIDIDTKDKLTFFNRVLKHEENIQNLLNELKVKIIFFESLYNKKNNSLFKKISFVEFCKNKKDLLNKFKDKFCFFIQGFMGRLYEIEINLKNQITIVEMIKKTVRIIIDDNNYNSERQLNILIVILTLIQFLVIPINFCISWLALNVLIPMKNYDSSIPFIFTILALFIIPFGQIFIIYKNKDMII